MTDHKDPYVVVGLGEILWDLLPEGKQLGGAPANFTYHAHALGARGVVVSAVGDDESGAEIREVLAGHGLETSHLDTDIAHPTGTVSVSVDVAGTPTYTIHEEVAWDYLRFAPAHAKLAASADAICFGSLGSRHPQSRACIRQFLTSAMPGCLRVLDINLRQHYYSRELILSLLEHAEVLKLNEDELPVLADMLKLPGAENAQMEKLADDFALHAIALTRGAKGSVLLAGGRREEHPGAPVDRLADTVGAGDSFTAMLVTGLLRGWPLDQISERANRLAAHVCAHAGAMAPYPDGPGGFLG